MADVLQMSYSDMEALANQFTTASNDLSTLQGDIQKFLTEIQSQVEGWKTRSTALSTNAEGTRSGLAQVVASTRGTWQGDQAERFESDTFPAIDNAIKSFDDALDKFAATLQTMYGGLESTLNPLSQQVQQGSEQCADDAQWVTTYKERHQSIG